MGFICVVIYLGIVLYRNTLQNKKEEIYSSLFTLARVKVNHIVNWRAEKTSEANFFYENFSSFNNVTDAARSFLKKPDYTDALLINTKSNVSLVDNKKVSLSDYEKALLDSCIKSNKFLISDIYRDFNNHIAIASIIPLLEKKSRKINGVLIFKIDPALILFPLIQERTVNSESSESFIVRREGDEVVFLNELRFKSNAALSLKLPLSMKDLPASMVVNGKTGIFEGIDYTGNKVLADLDKVHDSPWFIVSKIDMDEVYAPVKKLALYIGLGVISLIIICGLVLFSLWKNQKIIYLNKQLQLEKEKEAAERKIRKLSVAVEQSPAVIVITDKSGTIEYANQKFTELTGYTPDEAYGNNPRILKSGLTPKSVYQELWSALKNGIDWQGEFINKKKNGELFWESAIISPVKDSNGIITNYIAIKEDITERKRIEQELRKSKEELSNIIDTAMDGVITLDENQRVILFNKASEKIFGLKAEEAIGQPIEKFIPERYHMKHKQNVESFGIKDSHSRYMGENGIIAGILGSGEEILMEASISHFEIDGSKFYTVIHRDITERKKVEEALLKSERELRSFFEADLLGVIYWNMDLKIVNANNKFLDMMGFTREELENGIMDWSEMMPPEYKDIDNKAIAELKATGKNIKPFEKEYIRKDGKRLPIIIGGVMLDEERFNGVAFVLDITDQKEAQKALKSSEEKFEKVFRNSPVAKALADSITLRTIDINTAFEKLFGYSREEVIGKTSSDLRIYDNMQTKKLIELSKKDGTLKGAELIICRKNGERRTIELSIEPLQIEGKQCLLSVSVDITDRKLAERALRESEERFSTAFNFNPNSLVISNFEDGTILEVNDTFLELFGYNREEVIGKTSNELNLFANPEERNRVVNLLSIDGRLRNFELNIKVKSGESRIAILSAELLRTNTGQTILSIIQDITERKQLEQNLIISEDRVRRKLDSILEPEGDIGELELSDIIDSSMIQLIMDNFYKVAHIPMSIVDLKGNILVGVGGSKICSDFHKISPQTGHFCIENNWQLSDAPIPGEFKVYKCKNKMWEVASPVLIGGRYLGNIFVGQFFFENETIDYEFYRERARIFGFDEEEYVSSLNFVPRISETALTASMDFFINFSNMLSHLSFSNIKLARLLFERDQLMESLKHSQEDLKRSNKDLEQFAYIASHDLQEPIRMIKSYVQLFEIKYNQIIDKKANEYLNYMNEGATRMQQLVDDLLKYSRITTRDQEFNDVDCNLVLKDVLNDLKFKIEDENAIITFQNLPVVKGNETQIRQLFQNFLQNAIKFRSERRPEIKVACEVRGNFWLFSIADNGIGIPEKFHERIFLIFQRLHNREKYPGTGLGLAICKKIVERHGGQVCVDSEPDKGTIFYFTLPR